MRVYTLWQTEGADDDEAPWLIEAMDQYTAEQNDELAQAYRKRRDNIHVRELIVDVPEKAVRELFCSPTVKGTVLKKDQDSGSVLAPGSPSDAPTQLLQTARAFGQGDTQARNVAAAAYRLAAAQFRAWGDENHARDMETIAEGRALEFLRRAEF